MQDAGGKSGRGGAGWMVLTSKRSRGVGNGGTAAEARTGGAAAAAEQGWKGVEATGAGAVGGGCGVSAFVAEEGPPAPQCMLAHRIG